MSDKETAYLSADVKHALTTEWEFQNTLPVPGFETRPLPELIIVLEEYMLRLRAKRAWSASDSDEAKREVCKIAAMCLRYMSGEGNAIPRTVTEIPNFCKE